MQLDRYGTQRHPVVLLHRRQGRFSKYKQPGELKTRLDRHRPRDIGSAIVTSSSTFGNCIRTASGRLHGGRSSSSCHNSPQSNISICSSYLRWLSVHLDVFLLGGSQLELSYWLDEGPSC